MRDCPNCSQQIQDEAVFCRYCHTELEPPLWLTSMRKCPYCAEWIENELERCNYCDRTLVSATSQHAAPFIETSSEPADFTQTLRENLLDDDSDEAAAIAAAAAEFVADDTEVPDSGSETDATPYIDELRDYESSQEQAETEALAASAAVFQSVPDEPEPPSYEPPKSDLRRSLYEDESDQDESIEPEHEEPESVQPDSFYDEPVEAASYEPVQESDAGYVEPSPSVTDSGIWMAGAAAGEEISTGPLGDEDQYGRSASGTEGVSGLRADVSGPPGRFRRAAGRIARIVILVAVFGAAVWGLYTLSQGPVGASVREFLATDIPTETPIPEPTATLRPAPTLPPEATEVPAILPTEIGALPTELAGCLPWDAITLEDEGTEICAYGVIKRWWAGEDIPFIAIFSEDVGTFAIIDRTTSYPVGPGNCIMANGTIEIMGGTRPNIDAQGALEDCPEGIGES